MSIDPADLFVFIDDDAFKDEAKRRGFALLPVPRKLCAYCNEPMPHARTSQKYCCPEHKRRASLQRAGRDVEAEEKRRAAEAKRREADREAYNAYHRQYQREYRTRMTAEQKERHRVQQLASYHRRMAAIREMGAA